MVGLRKSVLATFLCLFLYHVSVNAGTYFAVPGEDAFFNISLSRVPLDNDFISLEKKPDDRIMLFLRTEMSPEIADRYRYRINYTGNIGQGEMTFWLYNVSIVDAGEFQVVLVGSRKVIGSQILVVGGHSDIPIIVERTIAQVNKDYVIECKTRYNSRSEINGFQTRFTWKLNDTILGNNSIHTVREQILTIHRLQREDRFDKYSCLVYDGPKLPSNASKYYQIDPKYGPSEELTINPSNRTYFVEEGCPIRDITCSADCHPDCIFTWDRSISNSATLTLGVIDISKGGNYTCTAQNPITNVSWTTSIEVIPTSRNKCSGQESTCEMGMCSSLTATTIQNVENRHISCTCESFRKSTSDKDESRVVIAVSAAGTAFACVNLGIILACYKWYRIRQANFSTTAHAQLASNDNLPSRLNQALEDVSNGVDRYSTIDEVSPKEVIPSTETVLKSESFRKKKATVRYSRQPSVSSRRTVSIADSCFEEEFETPNNNCLQDNTLPKETGGLIYIQPHFNSTED